MKLSMLQLTASTRKNTNNNTPSHAATPPLTFSREAPSSTASQIEASGSACAAAAAAVNPTPTHALCLPRSFATYNAVRLTIVQSGPNAAVLVHCLSSGLTACPAAA
jgi:hypothetical protein